MLGLHAQQDLPPNSQLTSGHSFAGLFVFYQKSSVEVMDVPADTISSVLLEHPGLSLMIHLLLDAFLCNLASEDFQLK